MKFLGWAAFYEGATDRSYFDILLPQLLEDIVCREAEEEVVVPPAPVVPVGTLSRKIHDVARDACSIAEAISILFIHADTGGRGLARSVHNRAGAYCDAIRELCEWPEELCVHLTPRHETEAWALTDPEAVVKALRYQGRARDLGLPTSARAAERLVDPKAALTDAYGRARSRIRVRGAHALLPTLAQTQSLARLREAESFARFEERLRSALQVLEVI